MSSELSMLYFLTNPTFHDRKRNPAAAMSISELEELKFFQSAINNFKRTAVYDHGRIADDYVRMRHFKTMLEELAGMIDRLYINRITTPVAKNPKIQFQKSYACQVESDMTDMYSWISRMCATPKANWTLPMKFKRENLLYCTSLMEKCRAVLGEQGIHADLINIVCEPLIDFCNLYAPLTHRQFEYIARYQRALSILLSKMRSGREVRLFCLHQGINSPLCFTRQIAQVRRRTKGMHDSAEQLSYYYAEIKCLQQIPDGLQQYISGPPILPKLLTWLKNEVEFCEKQRAISGNEHFFGKVQLDISVPEIALFVRLLIKANVLGKEASAKILHWVARHCNTESADDISAKSLRNKSWGPDPETVERVKTHLIGMVNELNEIR